MDEILKLWFASLISDISVVTRFASLRSDITVVTW